MTWEPQAGQLGTISLVRLPPAGYILTWRRGARRRSGGRPADLTPNLRLVCSPCSEIVLGEAVEIDYEQPLTGTEQGDGLVLVKSVGQGQSDEVRPGQTGTVLVFTAIRSTKEEPSAAPAVSPRLRRSTSPWPSGRHPHARPGVPRPRHEGTGARRSWPLSDRFEPASL
jgi:hypothetical protein